MSDSLGLRTTFNGAAELYNQARPRYPESLFGKLVEVTKLKSGSTLLEIGPGTGQATEPLARRGFAITAVELGTELATVARRELAACPKVEVITGAFEEVSLPESSFDLVYSATAFHWINPEIKFTKPHRLLKNGGYLAIIHTEHVSDEAGDEFFKASQPIYDKYGDEKMGNRFRIPSRGDLKPTDIDTSLFRNIYFDSFPIVYVYTAKQFTDLLSTYSPNLAMPAEKCRAFLKEIAELINNKFGGKIERHFAMTLAIAKKP